MDYFSMFSGIKGFEYAIKKAYQKFNSTDHSGNERKKQPKPHCVGHCEINKYAEAIGKFHFPNHKNYGDATKIDVSGLPDFDLLTAGFPCQAFSLAGKGLGFEDARGTLFFEIARVCKAKRPEWILLENVKNLLSHEDYKTFFRIYEILTELGYTVAWEVANTCQFGIPQNRERIFIVGHLTEAGGRAGKVLPIRKSDKGIVQNQAENERQEYSWAVRKRDYKDGTNYVAERVILKWQNEDAGVVKSQVSPTLKSSIGGGIRKRPVVALCDSGLSRQYEIREKNFPPLRSNTGVGNNNFVVNPPRINPISYNRKDGVSGDIDIAYTLTKSDYRGLNRNKDQTAILENARIRRLTPVECERLQGFPDGYTKYGIMDGEQIEISDTQRYKALGNTITIDVVEAFITNMIPILTNGEN